MSEVFEVRVVGNFHQDNSGSCRVGEQLLLRHEPNNRHDSNAIVVVSAISYLKIGHIRKDQAAVLVSLGLNISDITCTSCQSSTATNFASGRAGFKCSVVIPESVAITLTASRKFLHL